MVTGPYKKSGEKGKNNPGSPGLPFNAERKKAYCEELKACGESALARQKVGVCGQTVCNHRKSDAAFLANELEAMELYRASIALEIGRRGMQGVQEPIYWQGNICGWVTKYSDQLLLAHAKRHIHEYRDKQTIAHEGGVAVGLADIGKLSPENQALLRTIIESEAKREPEPEDVEGE